MARSRQVETDTDLLSGAYVGQSWLSRHSDSPAVMCMMSIRTPHQCCAGGSVGASKALPQSAQARVLTQQRIRAIGSADRLNSSPAEMRRESMGIRIKRDDAKTCFLCHSNPPLFRFTSLQKLPTEDGSLEPDCFVELLCTSCLRLEIGDFYEGFAQSSIPLGADESPDVCLSRQIGFAVVPLMLSDRESQLLIDELRIDGFEMAVN